MSKCPFYEFDIKYLAFHKLLLPNKIAKSQIHNYVPFVTKLMCALNNMTEI